MADCSNKSLFFNWLEIKSKLFSPGIEYKGMTMHIEPRDKNQLLWFRVSSSEYVNICLAKIHEHFPLQYVAAKGTKYFRLYSCYLAIFGINQ